jgi:hypothetical protein
MPGPGAVEAIERALAVLASLVTAPGDVRRHNQLVLREYEDLVRWARDDQRNEAEEIRRVEDELTARGMLPSGERGHRERQVRRDYAQRWRDRKSKSDRAVEDLRDLETPIDRAWRRVARKPWPTNPYADETNRLSAPWEQTILDEGL